MKPHLIIPMGGAGSRFSQNGYTIPKPLIEITGKPFFFWATISVVRFTEVEDITFIVLQQHVDIYHIDVALKRFFPEAGIVILPNILPGPVYTCMAGVKEIHDGAPVIFNDCDHLFKATSLYAAIKEGFSKIDGALLTFQASDPQFSYVKYNKTGHIIGTVEKKVVSERAICGAYVFRNVNVFYETALQYTRNCPYSECYMSGLYNILCEEGKSVVEYPLDFHVEFGTPEEYEKAVGSAHFRELL